MLRIFDELHLFFEDTYQNISIREYSRKQKISPPTASKLLASYQKEGILSSYKQGVYWYFCAKHDSNLFIGLSKLYWQNKLIETTGSIHKEISFRKIILFGSLAKANNNSSSDIDLFVDIEQRPINTKALEKKLNRSIQIHFRNSLKNPNLRIAIDKGIVIR